MQFPSSSNIFLIPRFISLLLGCWGVKISFIRSRIVRVAERMFTINHSHEYDYDQMLLGNFIWPIAKTNMVIN
jgi:hypothetical protein